MRRPRRKKAPETRVLSRPIPDFQPRSYQNSLLTALNEGCRRAVCVWHRRAGKDVTAWSWLIYQAYKYPGVYYYLTPTYAQGKKILWNGIDKSGRRFLDYIPSDLVLNRHDTDMYLRLRTEDGRESFFQIVGTDNIDSIVGTNPRVCVFSEYSIQNPRGWNLLRPILRENKGYALFLYTPRGHNHAKRLYEAASKEGGWYVDFRTINDTRRDAPGEDGSPVITKADVEEDIRTGMEPDLAQQEYYCSWTGQLEGAYFGYHMNRAYEEGRVSDRVVWSEKEPVRTAWDIGLDDETAIWFWQHRSGGGVNFIDYMHGRNKSLHEWVNEMYRKPYMYTAEHGFPHDIKVREWAQGKRRLDSARELLGRIFVAKKLKKEDQIDAARRHIHRCWWHTDKCEDGLAALSAYKRERDEKHETFKENPLHDWASHGADAFQIASLMWAPERKTARQTKARGADFDPMTYEQQQKTYEYEFDPMTGRRV